MEIGKLPYKPNCPHCNKVLDGFVDTQQDANTPAAGDLSVCVYCKHLLIFKISNIDSKDVLKLCYVSVDEFIELDDFNLKISEKFGRIIVRGRE